MKRSTNDAWSSMQTTTSTSGISSDVGPVVVTSPSPIDIPKGKCLHTHIHLILQIVTLSLTLLIRSEARQ